ncbi:MAG: hypothetical protein AB7O80_03730 [Acetobacteraceae bacterium]
MSASLFHRSAHIAAPHPSTGAEPPRAGLPPIVTTLSLALLGIVLAVVLFAALRSPLKDDIAWLLYVARRWMAGRELYVDLVEVNPPLIVWISAVPIWLSRWLGLQIQFVTVTGFIAVVLGCAWWTAGLMRQQGGMFADRVPIFAIIAIVLLILPAGELGQREHLLIAATLPYLAIYAGEVVGVRPSTRTALAAGVIAAIGCALKPRYVGVFAVLEFIALFRGLRPWRAMPLAAAATTLAYAGLVAVFCPAYLGRAVPLALALYGGTDTTMYHLFVESAVLLGGELVMIGLLVLRWRHLPERWTLLTLMVFAVISSVICFLDGKDWYYHRIPATVATVLALLCWAGSALINRHAAAHRARLPLAVAALVAVILFFGSLQRLEPQVAQAVEPQSTTVARLEEIVRREHARTYIAFSEWIALGFPVVNNTGVTWASRFDSMWALKGELWRARFDPHASKAWPVARWVVHDFIAGCPDIAVVDTREGTNYIAVLSAADPAFARAWSRYRQIDAFDGLTVYRRGKAGCIDPWVAASTAR